MIQVIGLDLMIRRFTSYGAAKLSTAIPQKWGVWDDPLFQDLQNELIKGNRPVIPLSGAELIANCQKLLTKARAVGMPVIHVRVSRRPDLQDAPRLRWARHRRRCCPQSHRGL